MLSEEKVFRDRQNPLQESEDHMITNYRFPSEIILEITEDPSQSLRRQTSRSESVSLLHQISGTLYYFGSGVFQRSFALLSEFSQPKASQVLWDIVDAIIMCT